MPKTSPIRLSVSIEHRLVTDTHKQTQTDTGPKHSVTTHAGKKRNGTYPEQSADLSFAELPNTHTQDKQQKSRLFENNKSAFSLQRRGPEMCHCSPLLLGAGWTHSSKPPHAAAAVDTGTDRRTDGRTP